jgi:UDP-N-acetylmuramate-alanine ligase
MPTIKQFNMAIEPETLDRLEVIAESSHMKRNQLAAVALGVLSEIEPKLFLSALGEIKAKYGRRAGAGRPPSGPRSADGNTVHAA